MVPPRRGIWMVLLIGAGLVLGGCSAGAVVPSGLSPSPGFADPGPIGGSPVFGSDPGTVRTRLSTRGASGGAGVNWALWITAILLMMLGTVVMVLIVVRGMTVGRLLGLGLATVLVLTGYLVEGRYGLGSWFTSRLVSEMTSRPPSDERARRVRSPGDSPSPASTEDDAVERSQDVFRREARRRRERRRRQAAHRRMRARREAEPDPLPRGPSASSGESEETKAPRVLGRAEGTGNARSQTLQVPVEWVLKWTRAEGTGELSFEVVRDEETVRTIDGSSGGPEGSSEPLPPGRYHFEVRSDGDWTLRVVEAVS